MEMPKLKLSPDSIFSFVVNHGEKILVALAILCSLPLAWGGLNALRSDRLSPDIAPRALEQRAADAGRRIDQDATPDSRKTLLAALRGPDVNVISEIKSWQVSELTAGPSNLGLDRPLLGDRKKRGTPKIFPLEQVMVVTGVAAIAKPEKMVTDTPLVPPVSIGNDPTGMGLALPVVNSPPAQLMPYAIISGLVPYKKQVQEYEDRYATTSFSDPERDFPVWRDIEVERQEVTTNDEGEWQKLSTDQALEIWRQSWAGLSQDPLPEAFKIGEEESYTTEQTTQEVNFFYSPLPTLAERPTLSDTTGSMMTMESPTWGLSVIHPWAIQEIQKWLENGGDSSMQMGGGFAFQTDPGMQIDGSNNPLLSTGPFANSQLSQPTDDPDGMLDDASLNGLDPDDAINLLDYRVFRFIDVTVEPGKSYRYRLTSRLWNPNYRVSPKFLEDPTQAAIESISSSDNQATEESFRIPSVQRVLVRLISKEEKKRGGLGSNQEILVLDQNIKTEDTKNSDDLAASGNYELHATAAIPGQLVSSKKESRRVEVGINARGRPEKRKYPTHDVTTDSTLISLVGEQELEVKTRITRGFTPPPPLEALLVDSSGNLEHVTAVNSAQLVQEYLPTLPGYRPPPPTEESMMGFPGF